MADAKARRAAGGAEVAAALQAGLQHHQAGNQAQAETHYREVLARDPEHADALHLLGVIRSQQGLHNEAAALITEALRHKPGFAPAHNNLGNALHALRRHDDAIASYRKALALQPDHASAHNNLGNAYSALNRHDEAVASLRQAIALRPDYFEAHYSLGNALSALNRHDEAVASFRNAIAHRPDYFEAHNNLGNSLCALNRHDEAVASLRQALALRPDVAEPHNNLGNALSALNRDQEAVASLRQALAIRPAYPEAHNNLGNALSALNRCEEALESYRKALEIKPDYAEAQSNLGLALCALKRHDEAIAGFRDTLKLRPDYAEAHNGLGRVLSELDRHDEALASYRAALALRPDYAEAHNNLGVSLSAAGRYDEAMAAYHRALEIRAGYALARFHLSRVRLLLKDFKQGWQDFECRIAARVGTDYLADPRAPQRMLPRPSTLLPLELEGKRLLLLPDQGLGDELFFLRFASRARARGAWLAYLCSPKIASMVERSGAVDRVVETPAQAGAIDHVFSVGDLPLVLGAGDGEPLPPALALTPLPERLAAARALLRALGRGPYLAVTWRAGTPPSEQHGQRRSLFKEAGIEPFAAALAGWSGEIVALQRRPQPGEVQRLSELLQRPVHDASELNEDLEAMLGLLATVDDYVAVSNTNVHLMAGLNRGGRVIVPNPPEWRWLHAGATSPWFPGFHLYRQAPGQAMEQALVPLTADLAAAR